MSCTGRQRWAAGALALLGGSAMASEGDALSWRASLSTVYDSNLLRLPAGADVVTLAGQASAADTVTTGSVGLLVDKTYGLQRINASLTATSQRFQRFDQFDSSSLNHRLTWNWALTPRLTGVLSSARTRSLSDFADLASYVQRNERTLATQTVEAQVGVRGPWAALLYARQSTVTNSQPSLVETDFRASSAAFGVQHKWTSGSQASLRWLVTDGNYLHRPAGSALFVDGYTERAAEGALRWAASAKSVLDVRLAHARREHPEFPQRDYAGLGGQAQWTWASSASLSVQTAWAREWAAYQALDANAVLTERWTLAPTWQASARTQLRWQLQRFARRFEGEPFGPLPAGLEPRRDRSTDWGLSWVWRPHRAWSLSASVQQLQRHSSRPGLGFNASLASLSLDVSL